jgi:DNA-binding transcriptional LysR family regulator
VQADQFASTFSRTVEFFPPLCTLLATPAGIRALVRILHGFAAPIRRRKAGGANMLAVNGALDVRLLRTLLLLVTECSVSRTAEILGQTQPTVSLALKRLREFLGDPILVRSGGALVPTERGLELRDAIPRLLAQMDAHLSPVPSFDPASSDRRFRIVAANCLGAVFLPRIFRAVARQAPSVRVDVVPMPDYDDLMARLAEGQIDLVVGNWPNPPEHLRIAPLLSTEIKCVVCDRHALAELPGPLTLDRWLAEDHLSPTSNQVTALSPIDGRLLAIGRKRRITASVPEYAIVPHVLAGTDLVFTTGAPFAAQMARGMPFRVLDAPAELGRMEFYLLWHDCKHHSPANSWLRQLLKAIAAELKASELARTSVDLPAAAE